MFLTFNSCYTAVIICAGAKGSVIKTLFGTCRFVFGLSLQPVTQGPSIHRMDWPGRTGADASAAEAIKNSERR